jgi:hypothetical protein
MNLVNLLKILSAFTVALIIIGTVLNVLSFCICCRKKLNAINTFKLIMFSSVADTISLYGWLLNHSVYAFFNFFELNRWTLFWCRFQDFYQYTSLHYSSWILVILTEIFIILFLKNISKSILFFLR